MPSDECIQQGPGRARVGRCGTACVAWLALGQAVDNCKVIGRMPTMRILVTGQCVEVPSNVAVGWEYCATLASDQQLYPTPVVAHPSCSLGGRATRHVSVAVETMRGPGGHSQADSDSASKNTQRSRHILARQQAGSPHTTSSPHPAPMHRKASKSKKVTGGSYASKGCTPALLHIAYTGRSEPLARGIIRGAGWPTRPM